MKVLVLGGSGMLGHALHSYLSKKYEVMSTIRSNYSSVKQFGIFKENEVREYVDALDFDSIIRALASFKPDVIVNCIGLIKQLPLSSDPLSAININALLPHRISLICAASKSRMIHISTDCVFSGKRGNYSDEDISDAEDLYGRTKYLGEVSYKPHTVTLRTSIIGRELKSQFGLVEWFLSQNKMVKGYKKAIFSGFTTNELAKIISDYVIPNTSLSGVYNVSSDPISKYDLLTLLNKVYSKNIEIVPDDSINIDRSLNSNKFRSEVGYAPPKWEELITAMNNNSNIIF